MLSSFGMETSYTIGESSIFLRGGFSTGASISRLYFHGPEGG